MKRTLLVTAVALLAGTSLAAAQGMKGERGDRESAAPAPAAQQHAPAEKMAPRDRAAPNHMIEHNSQSSPARETTGQSPRGQDEPKVQTAPGPSRTDSKPAFNQKGSEPSRTPSRTETSPNRTETTKPGATTGQGAAATHGAVNLTTEQRTKIRTVIKDKVHAQPLPNVNFSISVGAKVPRSVHFYPLPVEVVEVYPEWRGYEFILVRDEIIVIDPRSFEIVAILEA